MQTNKHFQVVAVWIWRQQDSILDVCSVVGADEESRVFDC